MIGIPPQVIGVQRLLTPYERWAVLASFYVDCFSAHLRRPVHSSVLGVVDGPR